MIEIFKDNCSSAKKIIIYWKINKKKETNQKQWVNKHTHTELHIQILFINSWLDIKKNWLSFNETLGDLSIAAFCMHIYALLIGIENSSTTTTTATAANKQNVKIHSWLSLALVQDKWIH